MLLQRVSQVLGVISERPFFMLIQEESMDNNIEVSNTQSFVDKLNEQYAPQSHNTRSLQEIQIRMAAAYKFPRNVQQCLIEIDQTCKRFKFAETAMYAYPRGGQLVEGPSIRLAECIAYSWGHIDFGFVELETTNDSILIEAYAWDLQKNVKQSRVFRIKNERHTRKGKTKLDDPRDIYENFANLAARRLRAAVLAIVPNWVVAEAVEVCQKTLENPSRGTIDERINTMVKAFADMKVDIEMLEKRLGHKITATTAQELATLQKIYVSLRDGMSSREQWFEFDKPRATSDLNDKFNQLKESSSEQSKEDARANTSGEQRETGEGAGENKTQQRTEPTQTTKPETRDNTQQEKNETKKEEKQEIKSAKQAKFKL